MKLRILKRIKNINEIIKKKSKQLYAQYKDDWKKLKAYVKRTLNSISCSTLKNIGKIWKY